MSNIVGQANLTHSAVFVDELARRGVQHAVLCPGSRSTPLAVAFACHSGLHTWVHVDERSAAYFALGLARERDEPVAILSTSGTAAANFMPAVVEARLSRIPLVVLTADRPPELRNWGAPQTIDQLNLYGGHAKWFADLPVPAEEATLVHQTRAVAARAVATSLSDPAGPVHLNFPFREPLLPDGQILRSKLPAQYSLERPAEPVVAAHPARTTADDDDLDALASAIGRESRGIVVCGPGETSGLSEAASEFAALSGYPLLADPLSGIRFGPHDRTAVVDSYDAFLRDGDVSSDLEPKLIIQVGAVPTSKPLQQFLAMRPGRPYVLIDPGEPRDPSHLATDHLRADPAITLNALAERLCGKDRRENSSWRDRWIDIDRASRMAIAEAVTCDPHPFEGSALADVAAALPDGATLVVGNSMPIRDADAFIRGDERRIRIVANRGANGIDGVVSTALGAAAGARGPVVLVIGDLSFFHDLNGLLAARRFGLNGTIVLLNNDGGGIFSFLPQAGQLDSETFERLFGTPIGLDFEAASRLYDLSFSRPRDRAGFRRALDRAIGVNGVSVVEYLTERDRNVIQHRVVWSEVSRALRCNDVLLVL